MKAQYIHHKLQFIKAAGTSRGVLRTKDSYYLVLEENNKRGIGECSILPKLSPEADWDLNKEFQKITQQINQGISISSLLEHYNQQPAIRFALEMAQADLKRGGDKNFFSTDFQKGEKGIVTNGLIWMGTKDEMFQQIKQKIDLGFSCVKLKIGAINWEEELDLLSYIRSHFSADQIELRVDANGAFSPDNALKKLSELAKRQIHSIEQPIAVNQWEDMAKLCKESPIDIALDEELIVNQTTQKRKEMLDFIKPQYIILKPSLIGGFYHSDEYISLAEERNIGWWITSALEGNIGLNAIAQYTASKNSKMPQGLGTGGLFTNNINSPLELRGEELWLGDGSWNDSLLK
jgi:o-succinylbenzoate synthase